MFEKLKYTRLVTPGIFIYCLGFALGWATGWYSLTIPDSLEDLLKLALVIGLGALYNMTFCREIANRPFYSKVNNNLVVQLRAVLPEEKQSSITWKNVRSVFYKIVDSDPSLMRQSEMAYSNGALWTGAADLRAISVVGLVVWHFAAVVGNQIEQVDLFWDRMLVLLWGLVIISIISLILSYLTTKRQIVIGNQQVEFILTHHREELREGLLRTLGS